MTTQQQQPAFALPTAKTQPTLSIETAKVLLHGPPKIGKSTLAASINPDHTLFIATEPGLGALEVYAQPVSTWDEFRKIGPALQAGGHQFKTVVIDTVDELIKFCTDKVTTDLGIAYPGDLEFGKGWAAVADEFRLRIGALASLGLGVWFISHSKDEEVKRRVGTITVTGPTISGAPRKFLTGFVDLILHATVEQTEHGQERALYTQRTENIEAGQRVPVGRPPLPPRLVLPDDPATVAGALRDALDQAWGSRATDQSPEGDATEEEKS